MTRNDISVDYPRIVFSLAKTVRNEIVTLSLNRECRLPSCGLFVSFGPRMYVNLHVTYNVRNLACVITGHEISKVASLRIVGCRITRVHRCFISSYRRCNVVNLNLVMARRRARTHLNNANIHIYILLRTYDAIDERLLKRFSNFLTRVYSYFSIACVR